MDLGLFLQQTVNGLAIGGIYALFAIGYTLIFGVLEVINLAHPAVFVLGAFFGYTGLVTLGLPAWLALPGAALAAGAAGVVVERLAFAPLRRRGATPLTSLISSIGVALFIVNLVQFIYGADPLRYPELGPPGSALDLTRETGVDIRAPLVVAAALAVGLSVRALVKRHRARPARALPAAGTWVGLAVLAGAAALATPADQRALQVSVINLITLLASILLMIGLSLVIQRTRIGRAVRAVAESPQTAALMGVNVDGAIRATFFLASALGGLAGVLTGLGAPISPAMGQLPGLKSLAVIVLGGLGDVTGAMLGGLVLGVAETMAIATVGSATRDLVAFALLFLVLVVRPAGLLGRTRERRA